ncbi:hypothetical protein [Microbacterium sp. NPDC055683]
MRAHAATQTTATTTFTAVERTPAEAIRLVDGLARRAAHEHNGRTRRDAIDPAHVASLAIEAAWQESEAWHTMPASFYRQHVARAVVTATRRVDTVSDKTRAAIRAFREANPLATAREISLGTGVQLATVERALSSLVSLDATDEDGQVLHEPATRDIDRLERAEEETEHAEHLAALWDRLPIARADVDELVEECHRAVAGEDVELGDAHLVVMMLHTTEASHDGERKQAFEKSEIAAAFGWTTKTCFNRRKAMMEKLQAAVAA